MLLRNLFLRFLGCFVAIYVILMLLPWVGLSGAYSSFFRGIGAAIYWDNDQRELSFQPLNDRQYPYYTRIEIANRSLLNTDDSGPVRHLDFDTLGYGWRPTALLLALIVSMPVSWKRRWTAIFWGLLWEHIFLLSFLGYLIWCESSEISLVTLSPFWKHLAVTFKETLIGQFGLAVPVVIWVLVTFRQEDFEAVKRRLARLPRALPVSASSALQA